MPESVDLPTPTRLIDEQADALGPELVESAKARLEDIDGWQYGEHKPSAFAAAAVYLESETHTQAEIARLFGVSGPTIRNARRSMGEFRDRRHTTAPGGKGDA